MKEASEATASPLGPSSNDFLETPEKLSPSENEPTQSGLDLVFMGTPFAVHEDFIPKRFKPFIIDDVAALSGRWKEIKHLTTPIEPVLARLGVGALRRRAVAAANLECELEVLSMDEQGNPVMRLKALYPMGVTKESTFPTDASPTVYADPDTCDWVSSAMWCRGCLLHVRRGTKGTLLDCRAVLSRHPDEQATDASPLLMLSWSFVDPFGDRLGGQQFYSRKPEEETDSSAAASFYS